MKRLPEIKKNLPSKRAGTGEGGKRAEFHSFADFGHKRRAKTSLQHAAAPSPETAIGGAAVKHWCILDSTLFSLVMRAHRQIPRFYVR